MLAAPIAELDPAPFAAGDGVSQPDAQKISVRPVNKRIIFMIFNPDENLQGLATRKPAS
jgi:hypothetical protein